MVTTYILTRCAGGLLWYEGDSDDASLNPALNAAMLMARYAPLASSAEKTRSYLVQFHQPSEQLFVS